MAVKNTYESVTNNAIAVLSKFSRGAIADEYKTTGSVAADLVLSNGKGYPVGKVVEMAGQSASGKSTLCMFMSKVFCERGEHVLFIDLEGGASEKQLEAFGLTPYYCTLADLESGKAVIEQGKGIFVVVSDADTFDDVADIFDSALLGQRNKDGSIAKGTEVTSKNKPFDHIFIDSLKAMTPMELKKAQGISTAIGLMARNVDALLQKYKKRFERVGTTCWLVNQLRTNLQGYQATLKSACGAALEYYSDIRMQIWKDVYIKAKRMVGGEEVEHRIGHIARLICKEKNRHTFPDIPVECAVIYGRGISNLYWYMAKLEAYGYLKTVGSYKNIMLSEGVPPARLQGDGKVLKWISDNLDEVKKVLTAENAFVLIPDGDAD